MIAVKEGFPVLGNCWKERIRKDVEVRDDDLADAERVTKMTQRLLEMQ